MTLKEYLYITEDSFTLHFHNFSYYHLPNANMLINLDTHIVYNNVELTEAPLSKQLNVLKLESHMVKLNDKDELSHFSVTHNGKLIYTEHVEDAEVLYKHDFDGHPIVKVKAEEIKPFKERHIRYRRNPHKTLINKFEIIVNDVDFPAPVFGDKFLDDDFSTEIFEKSENINTFTFYTKS